MSGPLAGVRVIDCSTVVLGPWAAQQLGDLGAEIIKVEPPEGDTTRQLGPMKNPNMGAFYLAVNRNKRSIVLDLKQEAGRQALLKLTEGADVFLHNYRPAAAKRLGLSYELFQAVNPGLVYVGTYGFRAGGPYGDKPAYDDIIQAASGIAACLGALFGEPRYVPTIVADKTSSMAVLAAVLAALYHKAKTGQGQAVEVPMFESLAAWVMVEHLYGETFIPPIDTVGYKRVLNRYRRPFKTRDGFLAMLPYTDQNWRDFFTLAGRLDLLADPRFKTLSTRLEHIELLYEELGRIAATRTSAEWLAALDRCNIRRGSASTAWRSCARPACRRPRSRPCSPRGRRGGNPRSDGMAETLTVDTPHDLAQHVGKEFGPGDWVTVDQAMIDKFAEITGDHQWIHVDVERAKREMPGGKTIAHGYLTLSLIPRLGQGLIKIHRLKRGLNYGSNKVRFTGTVPAGSRVRLRTKLLTVEPVEGNGVRVTSQMTIEVEGQDKPALIAETLGVRYA